VTRFSQRGTRQASAAICRAVRKWPLARHTAQPSFLFLNHHHRRQRTLLTMCPTRNATPGPSNASHVPLRNRNINKRQLEDAEDGRVEKAKRRASGREEGQGKEKKRRRRRKRKLSVVSTASENVPFVPTSSSHRQNVVEVFTQHTLDLSYDSLLI
jgi:hypothetical protein